MFGAEGQASVWAWDVWLCAVVTWIVVYFCIFKGVKSSSYVVWITVPLPVVFIFIMVMKGLTLENSDQGIRMYLLGEKPDGTYDPPSKILSNPEMWSDACAQIFFSIGVCMGVMTSYASYNPVNQDIIGTACQVAFGNSLFSFFAGFAVFSTVGYVQAMIPTLADQIASIGLAFVTYPAAINQMPGSNFWAFLLSFCLFCLGIDSAFSLVEAVSTVVTDTPTFKQTPRKLVALVICVIGAAFSTLFTFNWGFTYFDVVDHYLTVYLMLLLGIFQAFGTAWIYKWDEAVAASRAGSCYVLFFGYWVPNLILAVFGAWKFIPLIWCIVAFWAWMILVWIVSWLISGLSFGEWVRKVMFYGIDSLATSISALSYDEAEPRPWWAPVFEIWWGFSIKYVFSWACWFLVMLSLKNDLE